MDRGQQFPYDIDHTMDDQYVTVRATHRESGEPVGFLKYSSSLGKVGFVNVKPEHKRKGVATQMWEYATQHPDLPNPQHSTTRTEEGEAWAQALAKDSGHEVPEWKYLGVDLHGDDNG
jgi:hypothetical protein